MSEHRVSRRHFFYGTLLTAAIPAGGFGSVPSLKTLGYKSPNEKLNLAAIGAGGQPFIALVLAEADRENVVALADVDWERGQEGFTAYPKAVKYKDFRQMLDKSGNDIDAVVVGPPDHMHAACALACMELGKHVYVEKPLVRTSWEARLLTQAAAKYKVATQMGNQGYSHDATRVACEIIWSGEIGEVREVHAWTGGGGSQIITKIPPPTPVPDSLDWDLWLGVAANRPFTKGEVEIQSPEAGRGGDRGGAAGPGGEGAPGGGAWGSTASSSGFYLPMLWRKFYDFGTSGIGDWGIHILGPANWGLQLHPQYLISVECIKKSQLPPFTYPNEFVFKYEFAARPGMPPVTIYWYQQAGGDAYLPPGMTAEQARKIANTGPQVGPVSRQSATAGPPAMGKGKEAARTLAQSASTAASGPVQQGSGYNCIFVGSKGYLGTNGRGEGVGLLPGSRWADYKLPAAYLQRSPGASSSNNMIAHAADWVRACKGGAPSCSDFSIAGPYAEWLILGCAAVHVEGKLLWDNKKGEFTNNQEVNKWVKPNFRKGWELKL